MGHKRLLPRPLDLRMCPRCGGDVPRSKQVRSKRGKIIYLRITPRCANCQWVDDRIEDRAIQPDEE